ncbi:hypothetical protein KFK09_006022 [Dendrobium nobile]|uniref:RING-type domain-containing protein n=1 Tax=Dendrobium nobile TaxID=94219 RepID=A0A8T3C320_DENNO|nr:hypothetical protein KFK09_006022 [Dendrobium nobile]
MADLNSTTGSGDVQKAICTICFEDLKPILEDLQTLPICGHVFHELCIQQWLEYCPAGKKPTCPVCKQSCSRHNLTRLYFQSTGDSPQLNSSFSRHGPGNADVETLVEEVRRLEMKLAAVNTTFENQQALLKKLDEELSAWKQFAKEEELRKEEIKKEKEYNEQLLYMKMEELSMKTVEIAKLQERGLALAKELATLKLATDLNLEEEDMVRLASIGHGSNIENALDVLKKSLALRNKSYKDLMIQCNILGRSETRTCKKLDKAREKINKLKIRLQEVEKALEEKENEDLRDFKDSSRLKRVNLSYTQQNVSCPTIKDQLVWQYAMENSDHITLSSNGLDQFCRTERTELKKISSPLAYERSNHAVDRNMDSYNLKLIPDSNRHPALAVKCENGQADQDAQPISGIRSNFMQNANAYAYTKVSDGAAYYKFGDDSKDGEEGSSVVIKKKVTHRNISMVTTEKILMDDIQKEVPYLADQSEAAACVSPACLGNTSIFGSLVPEMVNRNTSRWSKHIQSMSSSGDLIVVGADGRGGRIKVLKARDECLGDSVTTVGSKRQKHGAKLRSQFNIEHFFKKTQ